MNKLDLKIIESFQSEYQDYLDSGEELLVKDVVKKYSKFSQYVLALNAFQRGFNYAHFLVHLAGSVACKEHCLWVPVSTTIPPENTNVLFRVKCPTGTFDGIGYRDSEGGYHIVNLNKKERLKDENEVLYWKHLP